MKASCRYTLKFSQYTGFGYISSLNYVIKPVTAHTTLSSLKLTHLRILRDIPQEGHTLLVSRGLTLVVFAQKWIVLLTALAW